MSFSPVGRGVTCVGARLQCGGGAAFMGGAPLISTTVFTAGCWLDSDWNPEGASTALVFGAGGERGLRHILARVVYPLPIAMSSIAVVTALEYASGVS